MNGIEELGASLDELRSFFERRKWKYCLVGGLAANRWGETRFTRDIDIVLMKALAGRPQDWRDIEGIIVRQGNKLDWDYIRRWLDPLLELFEIPERHEELRTLRERLAREIVSPFRRSKKSPRKKRGS